VDEHLNISQVIKTSVPIRIKLHPRAITALEALPVIPTNPHYFFWNGRSTLSGCIVLSSANLFLCRLKSPKFNFRDNHRPGEDNHRPGQV
jgi:hypothetical protein